MAIFERQYKQDGQLDDTQKINCIIETAQEVNGHIEYLLRLERGIAKKHTWRVLRRYNDFVELHKCLSISGIDLPLPKKRLFGNMRPDFIAERRQALQHYINQVLMNPILASSLTAKRFVDPDSYSQSFHDQAVQNALLCLRNENLWTLGTTMGAIGWRLRKHYFRVTPKVPDSKSSNKLVKSGSQTHSQSKHSHSAGGNSNNGASSSKLTGGSIEHPHMDPSQLENHELVLEWLEYGSDKYIDDKELGGILKSLMTLQHPYIEPVIYGAHNENGCLVIRKFHKHGTLKDILCMATPKNPFLSKYGNPKGRTALTLKQVATYGKQILEALVFLHSKGYPYGHLHSGNVVIIDDRVKLLDVENYLLGVPAFYKPFVLQHSKIHSVESVDVYCFGHVLFEMSMGYPQQESVVRQINECPENLKNLLESILSRDACKTGLPSLEQLLNHAFFKQHAATTQSATVQDEKPHFKLSLHAKDVLKQTVQRAENRLKDEQKSVKNQKRIVRVQELMSSEEEKRKSKQKARLEHKQSKLKQQSSLQTSNGRAALAATASASSVTESPDAPAAPTTGNLSRADSVVITPTASQDNSYGLKSPPPTPSAYQKNRETLQNLSQQQPLRQISSLASMDHLTSADPIDACETEVERSALLESICKFNRGSLRKVRSND